MASSNPPRDMLSILPTELIQAIGSALLISDDSIPATAIINPEESISIRALRSLAKASRRFQAIFADTLGLRHSDRLAIFLRNNTFHCSMTAELRQITSLTPMSILTEVQALIIEIPCLTGGVPLRIQWDMTLLTLFFGLTSLRLHIGAFDTAIGYACRRWMGKAPIARQYAYSQVVAKVGRLVSNLPDMVDLTIFMDSHAGCDGPDILRAARAVVTLVCKKDASGKWKLDEEPDEQEEEVHGGRKAIHQVRAKSCFDRLGAALKKGLKKLSSLPEK